MSIMTDMCGVIATIGNWNVNDVKQLLDKLSYRGYDSAGISYDGVVVKTVTKNLPDINVNAKIILAHTRWATHGDASIENAHPIEDDFAILVHNGIVENTPKNYKTDTFYVLSLLHKGAQYLHEHLQGMSVLVWQEKQHSDRIYFLRKGLCTLYYSQTKHGYILCSDASVIESDIVYYIDENQFGYVDQNGIHFLSEDNKLKKFTYAKMYIPTISKPNNLSWLEHEIEQVNTTMLQNIYNRITEQISELTFNSNNTKIQFNFIGMGSSYYVGKIAALLTFTKIRPAYAWRACEPLRIPGINVFVSQSGQTLDTIEFAKSNQATQKYNKAYQDLDTIEFAKYNQSTQKYNEEQQDLDVLELHMFHKLILERQKTMSDPISSIALVNRRGCALEQYTHTAIYLDIGEEISVASTKAFMCQLVGLLAIRKASFPTDLDLNNIEVPEWLVDLIDIDQIYIMGKGIGAAVVGEIALKLQELAYLHIHAYCIGEFKHGPLALVDENFTALVLNPSFDTNIYSRVNSNVEEILARGGKIIMVTDKPFDHDKIKFVHIPPVNFQTMPFVYVKFGQLLAVQLAKKRKLNLDQPRNLVKSVTVL